jgi:hypothetical protein
MTEDLERAMKERVMHALRTALNQRKEAIRERILSCMADHVEQELNELAEPPVLDDQLFALPALTGRGQAEQPEPSPAGLSSPANLSQLSKATQQLSRCTDQVSILESLIKGAARFSARAVVFVCRNGQAMGWEQFGFAANPHSMAIRGVAIPLSGDSVLSQAVSGGETLTATEAELASPVWDAIGTEASSSFTAVPLTVRGRIAAVLFADAGPEDQEVCLQSDALTVLARMAEMTLEAMTLRSGQGATQPARHAPVQPRESQPATVQDHPEEIPQQPDQGTGPAEEPVAARAEEQTSPAAEQPSEENEEHQAEEASTVADPEPHAETDPEEDESHQQARRFARLLISEILLYNPEEVQEGKLQHDLASRLREDLERSEHMYLQRVAPEVAQETDYFREEVIRTLAGGDPSVLGN